MTYALITDYRDFVAELTEQQAADLANTNPRNLDSLINHGYGYVTVGKLHIVNANNRMICR